MIALTKTQRIVYSFFAQTVILLLLFSAVYLLGGVKFLGADPLADGLPYHQVNALANVLLQLTALTGLLGGGVYVVAMTRADNRLKDETLLVWLSRGWTLLLLLAFFAGFFGLLEGRSLLELPPVLDIALGVLLAAFIYVIASSAAERSAVVLIWLVGMVLGVIGGAVGLFPANDFLMDRALRALAVGLMWNIGYVLAAVALGFWLIHRFSNLTPAWVETQLNAVAGLLALAGTLASLPPLYTLGTSDFVRTIGGFGTVIIPVCYLIYALHTYKALSARNTTVTLAAQWFGLGGLLLLIGMGGLGALAASPAVSQWTAGTRLSDTQMLLTAFGILALALGVINQATAELRGQNRRVTGLMPFWMIAFGIVGGALALGAAGLTQTYLERILGVGYLETQRLIVPLYAGWMLGFVLAAGGVLIYALGFVARRVEAISETA